MTAIGTNTRNYIGRTQWWDTSSASGNIDFNGTIDDFFLYDIVLTASEIVQVQSNTDTGINPTKENSFSLYPNPVSRNTGIQIKVDQTTADMQDLKVEVIDARGEVIDVVYPKTTLFTLHGLVQSGIYLIRITSNANKVLIGKLIVK